PAIAMPMKRQGNAFATGIAGLPIANEMGDRRRVQDAMKSNHDNEKYLARVQEIIRSQQLTRVPNSPEFLEGVMNLRGKIIPVIALRERFGLEEAPPDKQNRIVVVEIQGSVLGFVVDAVSEVLRIPADTIEPPPRLGPVEREYVAGVGKLGDRLLILLDADRLMDGPEQTVAAAASV